MAAGRRADGQGSGDQAGEIGAETRGDNAVFLQWAGRAQKAACCIERKERGAIALKLQVRKAAASSGRLACFAKGCAAASSTTHFEAAVVSISPQNP
jgi:hypothetical protein